MGSLFPCHVGCTPQAALADPQYIQELEQHLQQHQSDVISMDQQVEFAASQGLCTLPYHCTMPWECLCSWYDCSAITLPAGEHICTVQLRHIHCLPAKHHFDSAGPLRAMEGHTVIHTWNQQTWNMLTVRTAPCSGSYSRVLPTLNEVTYEMHGLSD